MVIAIAPNWPRTLVLDTRSNTRLSSPSRRLDPRSLVLGAAGLSRPRPITRVSYSLLGQAAIRH